jgi:hypothetical protein
MQDLIASVSATTGVDETTAKAAIGHVLLFLRNEAPQGRIGELIDKIPWAREAVAAAEARSDSGVNALMGVYDSLMGQRSVDVNVLYENLKNVGLDEKKATAVLNEVLTHAESLIGKEGVASVMSEIPALAKRAASSGGAAMRRGA